MGQRPHAHKPTVAEVSLFAYLTVHRPRFCPVDSTQKHKSSCMCLDMPFSVKPAPSKEILKMFGGTMEIEEYRKTFAMIKTYTHVEKFTKNIRPGWIEDRKMRTFLFEFAKEKTVVTTKPATTVLAAPRVQVGRAMIIRSNSIN